MLITQRVILGFPPLFEVPRSALRFRPAGAAMIVFLLSAWSSVSQPSLALAQDSSVAIAREALGAPAVDLQWDGREIDRDRAIDLSRQGVDLSTLNPTPTDAWQDTSLPAVEPTPSHFPTEGSEVRYDSDPGSTGNLVRARVIQGIRSWQLVLSMNSHAALARAALLRRLGYAIPSPRRLKTLKVRFKDLASRSLFLDQLSDATATARTRWATELPENDAVAVLQDVVVEPAQINVPQYHWGIIPASHLKGRRTTRSLMLPLSMLNIPESINLYSWEAGKIFDNAVILGLPWVDPSTTSPGFSETTFDDLRWIGRRVARLSREDLAEAVAAGEFPPDVAALVTEKLVARRNHLVEMLELKSELSRASRKFEVNPRISIGAVQRGRLTQAEYPGYPMYFTALVQPKSPLRGGQIWRYLAVDLIGNTISLVLDQLSSRFLSLGTPNSVLRRHQQDLIQQVISHYQQNPDVPYQQRVAAWAGPVAGFNVTAGRDVVTGTYYGSESKVQLVDTVGVRASIGLFGGVDGIANRAAGLTPSGTAEVSVTRNYVHVRPIADMRDALKTDWKDLFVAGFMGKLAGLLKTGPDASPEQIAKQLKEFLSELRPNESFIVTDTLGVNLSAQATIPIPVLMNPALRTFNPSLGLKLSEQPQILRRTTFVRTEKGIQVYLQDSRIASHDIEFNARWLISIFMAGANKKEAYSDSDAILIDTDELLSQSNAEQLRALTVGLRSLLRFQQVAPLREKFAPYELDHELRSRTLRARLLPFSWRKLKEEHTLTASPPGYPQGYERTLFSQKVVSTQGVDGWSLLSDLTRSATLGLVNLGGRSGPNPAYSFMGQGHWTTVQTEAEITPSRPSAPVTLIEHSWGGWILKRAHLVRLLERIQNQVKTLNLDRPLVRREEFASTRQLQLYQISSRLIVYEKGTSRLQNDLIAPEDSQQAIEAMIAVEGRDALDAYCAQEEQKLLRKVRRIFGPLRCLKPWMKKALEIRQLIRKKDQAKTPQDRVRLANLLMRQLERKLDLAPLLQWIGKDAFFFQIRISGFRTRDENGESEYLSDSVGTRDPEANAGAFRDFVAETGISANEVLGSYLSEGY